MKESRIKNRESTARNRDFSTLATKQSCLLQHSDLPLLCSARARLGFTLIELMMVIVILVIAALAVVPMLSSGASVQVQAAADRLAADLEYAKSMAITHASRYRVVFNISQNYYQIRNSSGNVIKHPVNKGQDYTVDFDAARDMDQVKIDTVNFDGTSEVRFDSIGSPYDGSGTALNLGQVSLVAGNTTEVVTVEPVTGLIKVSS